MQLLCPVRTRGARAGSGGRVSGVARPAAHRNRNACCGKAPQLRPRPALVKVCSPCRRCARMLTERPGCRDGPSEAPAIAIPVTPAGQSPITRPRLGSPTCTGRLRWRRKLPAVCQNTPAVYVRGRRQRAPGAGPKSRNLNLPQRKLARHVKYSKYMTRVFAPHLFGRFGETVRHRKRCVALPS